MKFLGFEEVKSELVKLEKENEELKKEIKRLKEPKAILNIDITPEELAKQIVKELNKDEEHICTTECFENHVIKAIQNDYDLIDSKNKISKYYFLEYWFEKLTKEYTWLKCLQIIDDKIYFK